MPDPLGNSFLMKTAVRAPFGKVRRCMKIVSHILMIAQFLLLVSCATTNPSERLFPDELFFNLSKRTGVKHWDRIYGAEAITIAQQAKERYYIANNLWTEQLKKMEDENKLMVNVFQSSDYIIVTWFSVEQYSLDKHMYYATATHEICYSSRTGEVVSIGMGGTPLGDIFKTPTSSSEKK